MSHGPMTEGIKADPNLTPLLDIVLQLVMFFMVTLNFVAQTFDLKDVELPMAQSARPLDPVESDILFLNINSKGELVQLPRAGEPAPEPLSTKGDIRSFIFEQYRYFQRLAAERGKKPEQLSTLVIIRPSKQAEYKDIYHVLRCCKDAGFSKLQLRAFIENR
jgi:biopolymer transport protein ExbD